MLWQNMDFSWKNMEIYTPPRCIFGVDFHCWCVLCSATQSCPTLCDPMDCNPPASSVHGILQAKILGWVAISFSRASSPPRDRTHVPCIAGWFFTTEPLQHCSGPVFKSRLLCLGIVQASSSLNHLIFCACQWLAQERHPSSLLK